MKTKMNPNTAPAAPLTFAAYVGLDWGDKEHALSLCAEGSRAIERSSLEQSPEALVTWVNGLRRRFPGGRIAVCLEQSRGPLVYALMAYEHLVLYPVNPKTLARFREALYPSRSKDDPVDADLALTLVRLHRGQLRPWQPDTVETRQLALLVEQRRHFVDLRTQLTNQLGSHLKAIFPQALELVGEHLGSPMATDFLQKWPSLQDLQKIKPATLRKFYYGHNSRSEELIAQRLELLRQAVPLTADPALLAAHSLAIRGVAAQLSTLRPLIAQHERQIQELFAAHPDQAIFASLPGAGEAFAPRLLVSFGTDRSRFADSTAMPCYSGIAPVTEKSSNTQHWVHVRWNCPKFMRQSWHEFAASSISFSPWARCCYEHLRTRMNHHEAVRKLAYKWQRIAWRMWQDRLPYDEAQYVRSLQRHGLELYADLQVESTVSNGE